MKKRSTGAGKKGKMGDTCACPQKDNPVESRNGKASKEEDFLRLDCHMNWINKFPKLPHKMYLEKGIPNPDWFDRSGKSPEIIASEKLGIFCFKSVLSLVGGLREKAALALKEADDLISTPDILKMKEPYQVAFRYVVEANAALLAYRAKLYDKADKAYQRTLKLDLTHLTTRRLLLAMKAAFLEYLGDVNGSLLQLREVVKLEPVQPKLVEPKLEPVEPKLKTAQPKLKSVDAKLEPVEPKLKLVEPKLKPVKPKLEPVKLKLEPVEPKLEPVTLKLNMVEPEYLEWLYRSIRKVRRKHDIEKCSGPTLEEFLLIEKAMEVHKDEVYTNLSMVTLYEDILRARSHDEKYTCQTITAIGIHKIVSDMKAYAGLAWVKRHWPSDGIQYAEVLLYNDLGHIPNKYWISKRSLAAAKVTFYLCEQEFPEDAGVLNAVGKFRCMYPDKGMPNDVAGGVGLLLSSVQYEPLNLELLLDYFRFAHLAPLKSEDKDLSIAQVFMKLIDTRIDICVSKLHDACLFGICTIHPKLLCLKATLLCKEHKFKEAILFWNQALEMDPGIETAKKFSIFGKNVFIGLFYPEDYQLILHFILEGIDQVSGLSNPTPAQVRELRVMKKLLEVI